MAGEKREEKINKILNATVECALLYGIDSVQITQIAECAGMSPRTINRYYPEKGILLAEAVTKYLDNYFLNYMRIFDALDKDGMNGRNKLLFFLKEQFKHYEEMDALMTDAFMIVELRFCQMSQNNTMTASKLPGVEQVRKTVVCCLEDGKKDGSIRADLETDIASALISSSYNGMMQRLKTIQHSRLTKKRKEKSRYIFVSYIEMLELYLKP